MTHKTEKSGLLSTSQGSIQVHEAFPIGKCCICGLYNAYDPTYPPELSEYIDETEYSILIEEINDRLTQYWPCCCCFVFGYLCTICSCGLSLLCPNLCIAQAEEQLNNILTAANEQYNSRGLHFSYSTYNCATTSKILIHYGNASSIQQYIEKK